MNRSLIRSVFLSAVAAVLLAPAAEANIFAGGGNLPDVLLEYSDEGVLIGPVGNPRPDGAIFGQAVDSNGNLFISDTGGTVTRVAAGTRVETTFVTGLSVPQAVGVNSLGEVFVSANGGIFQYAPDGTPLGVVSFANGRLAFGADDTLYIGSLFGDLWAFTPNGGTVLLAKDLGKIDDLEYNAKDGTLYAAIEDQHAVSVFSTEGAVLSTFSVERPGAGVNIPFGLALLPDDTLFVSMPARGTIRRYDMSGLFLYEFEATSTLDIEYFNVSAVTVPESSTFALALPALGIIGAVAIRRRKK